MVNYSCKTKSEMSDKGKYPKNVVQTRGKGKSKAGGDSDTSKTNTHSDKNYETDEPLAVARADRIPPRDYSSDVATGGPKVSGEPAPEPLQNVGAKQRQLAPAVRSLDAELADAQAMEQQATMDAARNSDAESVRSSRRGGSRLSQQETVRKKKTKSTAVPNRTRAAPEGVTGDDTASEAVADAEGAKAAKKNNNKPVKETVVHARQCGEDGLTDMERGSVASYGSRSSRRSRISATASELENFRRDMAELRRQVRGMRNPAGRSEEEQIRDDRRLAEIIQTEYMTAETDGGDQQRPRRNGSRRPRAQPHHASAQHIPPPSDDNNAGRRSDRGHTAAAGAGAPGGGDDDDDGGDSDRDWYRHHRDRHLQDAARRRAARMSDYQDSIHPPSRASRRGQSQGGPNVAQPQTSGYINPVFDAGKIAADAVAAASAAWQALAPTRMHIEQVNLPKFNGKDFLLFLKQFEAVVSEQKWSRETCAHKLLESLEGDTRRHVETTMDYDEMLEALRQYYAGSLPSIEAKNYLRHMNKERGESIEAFATRIQAYADQARLSTFDKLKYMQEAFMNGIRSDTKMQRYIEKRTSQHENVHIVKLLKAAQDYQHDKQGTTQVGQGGKAKLNNHKPKGKNKTKGQQPESQPQLNVMKGGRQEPLTHDDPEVEQEAGEEQEKAQNQKGGNKKNNNQTWRKRFDEAEKRSAELRDQLQKAIETVTQQAQAQQQRIANYQNRGNGFRNNNNGGWNGNNGSNQRSDGFRNNSGFRNNGFRNDGYRSDGGRSDGNRSAWRGNSNYQDSRVFNNSGYNGNQQQPPRQDGNRPPANISSNQQSGAANAGGSAPPAPAQLNKHAPSQTDNYGFIDPSVYPEDGMYEGSGDGGQA